MKLLAAFLSIVEDWQDVSSVDGAGEECSRRRLDILRVVRIQASCLNYAAAPLRLPVL